MRLFIDTGPVTARYSKADVHHTDAVESFNNIGRGETHYQKLYTSDYVLDEAVTLCRRRTRSHKVSVELGEAILSSKSIVLLKVDGEVLEEAWEFYKNRSEIALSLTDCTTAVLAGKHGITDIFTYDADFQSLGFHAPDRL